MPFLQQQLTVEDNVPNPGGSNVGWTLGGTVIEGLPLQPSLLAPWTIEGWTIGFDLLAFWSVLAPIYGRLGNICGGLCEQQRTPDSFWRNKVLPFPVNASLVTQIWEGDQSPCPPIINGGGPIYGTPPRINLTYPLPQPVIVQQGDQLSIGIWITPSLTANLQLVLLNATWSIAYEERSPAETLTTA